MATITRSIQIHPDRETAYAECLEVLSYGANGWIVVNVTDSESVTVFLTEQQMQTLAHRLAAVADERKAARQRLGVVNTERAREVPPSPFPAPFELNRNLYARQDTAEREGQARATLNGAPVAILERYDWFAVCEEPPDDMASQPLTHGWTQVSVIEPQTVQS